MVPEVVPAGTDGATTSVAIWLLALVSSSSQVMNTAVDPDWYAELFRIFGSSPDSHWSPVLTEQSCMSLHRFGVMNVNLDEMSGVEPSGTSCAAHADVMFV